MCSRHVLKLTDGRGAAAGTAPSTDSVSFHIAAAARVAPARKGGSLRTRRPVAEATCRLPIRHFTSRQVTFTSEC